MLVAEKVTFGYSKGTTLLDGWDARFEAGSVTAITGPSGRGKSTLLYLLGLMLTPQGGAVLLDGNDVSGLDDAARARLRAARFGFVFQDAALDPTRTVLENVTESALYRGKPRHEVYPRAQELLTRFGVAVRATARPGEISGGQAQRIALCRALLHSPDVVLADEPTGNLDPASADVVLDAFRGHANGGAAVVVVTHDPRVVARCDVEVKL
ncbi:MAG TPA: ATP-binding cassette domain-containing protein [Candidatus Lumbricidophila sp.]|nr:ATP-binding cassette domain-containing protein [Candidatus Lumbricidophila sp.]